MKRFAVTSLSVAASFFLLCVSSFALNPSEHLTAGYARLDKSIDTSSATQGQTITARLAQTVDTPEGLKLHSGTELIGRVDQVQASHDSSPAKLVLTFDQARLKDGKDVPIKATLVGYAPAGAAQAQAPPQEISARDKFEQKPYSSSGTTMRSSIESSNSAVLTRPDKNIKLDAGTELQIAIAPASAQRNAMGS